MLYTIRISNKSVDPNSVNLETLYFENISPTLLSNIDTTYEDFISDMTITDNSIYIPLYNRNQAVKILANSVLVINTDSTNEAIYYRSLEVNNSLILINPDPMTDTSGATLIEKTITENGTYHATDDGADGYSTVNVDVSGGGSVSGNDVVFYDYEGSIVSSYSAVDFAQLSSMPANPSHTGLTAQGWNWSLADAKSYVASYGKLNIGQMYTTSDGKTRLYFTVTKDALLSHLYIRLGSDTELDVDWGDESEHTIWKSDDYLESIDHKYTSAGRYVIAIEVITGEFYFSQAITKLYKIEIGNAAVGIDDSAFSNCSELLSITIPDGVTSIGEGAFSNCYALSAVTIPNSVTSINSNTFYECWALSAVAIPDSVTSIGEYAFQNCYVLSSLTIPDGVPSISEYAFSYCATLSSVTIPNSVTSIGGYVFSDCRTLLSLTIPSSVTSIGEYAIYSCYALSSITFESLTPPELYGSVEISTASIIRVPQGSLSTYTSAENYPDPEYYIYEEY